MPQCMKVPLCMREDDIVFRKKKKNKAKEVLEAVEKAEERASGGSPKSKKKKTPAELAFLRVQEKRVSTRVSEPRQCC